jgi:chromosome segregation ATPase
MATIADRVRKLETSVERLETWAGPGQVEALIEGQRDLRTQIGGIRGQLAKVQQVQENHTTMIAGLKTDVAGLKTDMAWVKDMLQAVLRRLPPAT